MEIFENLRDIHETDYELMVSASWTDTTPGLEPTEGQQTAPNQTKSCCVTVCMSCDALYPYI